MRLGERQEWSGVIGVALALVGVPAAADEGGVGLSAIKIADFEGSLRRFPLIPPGTPDPYTPPR